MAFEGVIFDFDGVVVDSEHIAVDLDRELLAAHGVEVTGRQLAAMFIGVAEDVHDDELQRLARGRITEEDREWYDAEFRRRYAEVRAMGGIEDVLRRVTQPKAIASNNRREWIRSTLRRLSLDGYFGDRICAWDDVEAGKPEPDVYIGAAARLGIDPTCCAAVEDSSTGMRAARAAGMSVFGLVGPYFPEADIVALGGVPLERLGDVQKVIAHSAHSHAPLLRRPVDTAIELPGVSGDRM
ncbi:HAD family hydrolase [Microbacterium aurugineum]|uniref:HAD family hydrolase n=1 Tax=Microbacterium aurugineum TaxID=2851642 RepID=UPI0020C0492C|nr:HAD family phosphatase [Microbacterium aurugineum]MCK8478296.1 HAD family phosphatase [Microbacterium aurugineum]